MRFSALGIGRALLVTSFAVGHVLIGSVLGQGLLGVAYQTEPTGSPGTPVTVDIDYLPYFSPAYVRQLIDQEHLEQWSDESVDVARGFELVKAGLINTLRLGMMRDGIQLPNGIANLNDLPTPELNRMVLNTFARKGDFLPLKGQQVAFMSKVIRDSKTVKWVMLGDDKRESDFPHATVFPVTKPAPYYMNCGQFIGYSAYLAGLPEDSTDTVPMADKAPLGMHAGLLDTSMASRWRGWWKPMYGAGGSPMGHESIAAMPGDLIVLHVQTSDKNAVFEWRTPGSFNFFHVEVIARVDNMDTNATLSIGNSGTEPHVSHLLGKSTRFAQWFDENYPFYLGYSRTLQWKAVLHRFVNHPLSDHLITSVTPR